MYKNILVPMALDHGFGDTALAVARQNLAPGGTITALHVHEAPQSSVRAYLDDEVVKAAFETTKKRMEDRVAGLDDVTPRTVSGHSGRTIIDEATALGADLIVMGSHKPGLSDFLLGSTAARVVRHAPCAVHVLRTA